MADLVALLILVIVGLFAILAALGGVTFAVLIAGLTAVHALALYAALSRYA